MEITRRKFGCQMFGSLITGAACLAGWFKSSKWEHKSIVRNTDNYELKFGEKSMTLEGTDDYLEVNADDFDLVGEDSIRIDDGGWHHFTAVIPRHEPSKVFIDGINIGMSPICFNLKDYELYPDSLVIEYDNSWVAGEKFWFRRKRRVLDGYSGTAVE